MTKAVKKVRTKKRAPTSNPSFLTQLNTLRGEVANHYHDKQQELAYELEGTERILEALEELEDAISSQ